VTKPPSEKQLAHYARMAELSRSRRGIPLSAEHRQKMSAALKGVVRSEEQRAGASRAMKERYERGESSLTAWYSTEEGRQGRVDRLRKKNREWNASPEGKAHLAKIHDSWLRAPEGTAVVQRNYMKYGYFAEYGEMLRERDGDLCQLCLDPIDFELPTSDPLSRSVDHVVPVRAGGTDDPGNLWLAHIDCNRKKGARHCGRLDGSTDPR
jgi:5-methylcytosine-specific restriction endonuclease McrA